MKLRIPVIEFIPTLTLALANFAAVLLMAKNVDHLAMGPRFVFMTVDAYCAYCLWRLCAHDGKPISLERRKR